MNNEQLIQGIMNAIPDGVAVLSPDLTVIRTNSVLERYFKSKLPLSNRKCYEILQDSNAPCDSCPVLMTLKTHRNEHNEILMKRKDGRHLWMDMYSFPIMDEHQNLIGLVVYSRDITLKKFEMKELIKNSKLNATATLASGIAHDFNNLLYAIKGNVDLAKIKNRPRNKIMKNLTEVEKACNYARDLTNKFILLSSVGAPQLKPIRIDDIILTILPSWIQNSNIIYRTSLPDHPWRVLADREQISRVLYELVKNAEEAMPEGGYINISLTHHRIIKQPLVYPVPKHEAYIRLDIADNGPGIPANFLPIIFDPYFSTKARGKRKGMGLGLAMVNSVIECHGGNINIQSEEGSGSTFTIYLPAVTTSY